MKKVFRCGWFRVILTWNDNGVTRNWFGLEVGYETKRFRKWCKRLREKGDSK